MAHTHLQQNFFIFMHILQAVGGRNHTYQVDHGDKGERKETAACRCCHRQAGQAKVTFCISTSMHILLKMCL